MSEPRRWVDDGATDVERRLLSSWENEQPSAHARARVLGLVAGGAAATGASSTAAAAGGGAGLGKSILIGALAGALFVGASEVASRLSGGAEPRTAAVTVAPPRPSTPNADQPQAPVTRRATPVPAPERGASIPRVAAVPLPAAPVDTPSPSADATTATDSLPSPAPPASAHSNLLAQVDRARATLAGGDAARCLSLLDAHDAEFPGGALAQEAALLRIEALVKLGQQSEAAALGRAFAGAHPGSPDVAKVRELVNP